ncbi:hypothetical protein GUITHDRAFT_155421 [Guillardia theta CCMP2712]|uniref:Uncharacterized protein n=1 Tax=Guillardia theta (strain CCMP2712) TaxID=905079 RepID=L1IIQ1_GUITC|nr:hypothetical protein GUITHDRAFT_155421 [Guillardia theta CCMP2712]EKX35695.1 hypothetical protein GUITHDRAFT_155421 [Guillardia theta CCMP2712]|eukprot:XP_005822675.1 hypothetical protein GUITHDRAFT_155421 [Guillardia theta CCMP2712]
MATSPKKIAEAAADAVERRGGGLLAGFPRTMEEAEALEAALKKKKKKLSYVILIDDGDEAWFEEADAMLAWYDERKMLKTVDGTSFDEVVEEDLLRIMHELLAEERTRAMIQQDTKFVVEPQLSADLEQSSSSLLGGASQTWQDAENVRWIDPRTMGNSVSLGGRESVLLSSIRRKEYTSNERLRIDMRRHERSKHDPTDKYATPLTSSMVVGWGARKEELYKKDPDMFHPRMKSRETMFAEALILGPRHP